MNVVKEEAKKLINKLPEQATWDDKLTLFLAIRDLEFICNARHIALQKE
ncbi:MAG: hypothetical protein V3U15_01860 [Nitrospinota bacterium]